MGDAIRIADLAKHMISLSGMTIRDDENPAGDVAIIYVGLRPGEKLYEELFVGQESVATEHPRIRKASERYMPWQKLQEHVAALREAIGAGDAKALRRLLQELIAEDRGATSDVVLKSAVEGV
jgi:FlaA1/EpsC-like NDP-sugar epimerase